VAGLRTNCSSVQEREQERTQELSTDHVFTYNVQVVHQCAADFDEEA